MARLSWISKTAAALGLFAAIFFSVQWYARGQSLQALKDKIAVNMGLCKTAPPGKEIFYKPVGASAPSKVKETQP